MGFLRASGRLVPVHHLAQPHAPDSGRIQEYALPAAAARTVTPGQVTASGEFRVRWERGSRSRNVEDRRAQSAGRGRAGRAGIPLPTGRGGKLSLGSVVIMLALYFLVGPDALTQLGGALGPGDAQVGVPGGAGDVAASGPLRTTPQEQERIEFVSFLLDDAQQTWAQLLPGYRDAKLVLYRDATRSACGMGQAQMGPFYCPADQKVYVDLSFYDELHSRFGAPGDFAQAYVLAHELGHHVQRLTGIEAEIRRSQRARPQEANQLSVAMELQADCLAGVWGHAAGQRGILEPGDIEEGLRAAAAIGDDRIQRMSGRGVQPESFTHGSSAQRQEWLRRGLASGDPDACDIR
jgi:predicted metalloprotease